MYEAEQCAFGLEEAGPHREFKPAVTKVVTEKTRTGWLLAWLQRNRVSCEPDST